MSQYNFGNLESPLSGTTFINTHLEPWRNALHSMHSGTSRPSYAIAGMMWLNTTTNPWVVNVFDGTDDISIGTINTTTNLFSPSGVSTDWCGSTGGTANAFTLTPSPARTAYTTGDAYECLITTTNTSETVTGNVSSLGTKNVKTHLGVGKVNIPIGALPAGMVARFVYDGTDLLLTNVRPYNPATAVASASTVNLDTATGDYVEISGTTTITAVTLTNGQERTCRASGAFLITHGASLILPGAANILTTAGDTFVLRGEPSGVVRMINYTRNDGQFTIGAIPQNSKSAAYTTVRSDAGKHIFHPSADTTARIWTIDSNANVPYPIGTAITFVNQNGAGVITIAITSDTMRLAGPGTTGSRTLAANGIATALKVTSTEWIISGTGLT